MRPAGSMQTTRLFVAWNFALWYSCRRSAREAILQSVNEPIHFFSAETQWRQQAQHLRISRRSRNDLLFEQRFMNFLRAVREFKSKQKTTTMHIHDLREFFQTFAQIAFDFANIVQHAIAFNGFERRGDRRHCNHSAPERRTEIILFDMRSDLFGNQTSADRNSAAQRFRQRN